MTKPTKPVDLEKASTFLSALMGDSDAVVSELDQTIFNAAWAIRIISGTARGDKAAAQALLAELPPHHLQEAQAMATRHEEAFNPYHEGPGNGKA